MPCPSPSSTPAPHTRPALKPTVWAQVRVCPECAGPIVRNSGCVNCLQCGWGKCQ